MKYNNKFEDGESVVLKDTGEKVTVNRWSYSPKMKRYTYSVIENPATFYFEEDFEKAFN